MIFYRFKPEPFLNSRKLFRLTDFGPNCITMEFNFVFSLGKRRLPSLEDNGLVKNFAYLHSLQVSMEYCVLC